MDGAAAADAGKQLIVVVALVLAAQKQHRVFFHTGKGGERRLDVGALGVVDEGDAVLFPHRLDAVVHPAHGGEGAGDDFAFHPHQPRGAHGGEGVFHVVRPVQGEVCNFRHTLAAVIDAAALHIGAFHLFGEGEPAHGAAGCRRHIRHGGVVVIEHGELALAHVLQNFRFEEYVIFHGIMAVEVVFGDIGDDRHMRADRREGL